MPSRIRRCKISTTVSPDTHDFLKSFVRRGRAANLSEAVDRVVAVARRAESRMRLAAATSAYYDSLSGKALREERKLEKDVARSSSMVDFDGE